MDNSGFKSIGALSRSLGQGGFGTRYVRPKDGKLSGDDSGDDVEALGTDYAANARSLGAVVLEPENYDQFVDAFKKAHDTDRTTVVTIRNDRYEGVPGYDSWWDVPPAEVSEMDSVAKARKEWESMVTKERYFL
jgi:3D-(3,5/4)-trihydroxycyclohexane-1,2-dione acylhydrolase (decyclizing)